MRENSGSPEKLCLEAHQPHHFANTLLRHFPLITIQFQQKQKLIKDGDIREDGVLRHDAHSTHEGRSHGADSPNTEIVPFCKARNPAIRENSVVLLHHWARPVRRFLLGQNPIDVLQGLLFTKVMAQAADTNGFTGGDFRRVAQRSALRNLPAARVMNRRLWPSE